MPRVAFVLRSTEVHPDCYELCHTCANVSDFIFHSLFSGVVFSFCLGSVFVFVFFLGALSPWYVPRLFIGVLTPTAFDV